MSTGETQQQTTGAAPAEAAEAGVLDQILSAMPKAVERNEAREYVSNLVQQAMEGTVTFDKTVVRTLRNAMRVIDEKLSKQLAAIMHHPEFQKLEGSWRGLHYLVFNTSTSKQLKLRMLNVSKRDLFKDLDNAIEFDQSVLFKKIYENEFGMPGGEPYGALIGDYEFTNHPEDVGLLKKISGVAASAFAPFVSSASPELFGFESWEELSRPRDVEKIFLDKQHIPWNSFRDSEDSRFVTLTMPRVLSRMPYGSMTKPVDAFNYEEVELNPDGSAKPVDHDKYTWMNAAYVYGTKLTTAFRNTGWCTAIRGFENGGKIEDLPCHIFKSDDGDQDLKCPTEIAITDRREKELSDQGFLPLCHYKNTDYAVFFGAQTTQRPKEYDRHDATANAAISARLPYIMATSRIAHYLKVIARDAIGSFKEERDMQRWLNRWISNYVLDDPNPSEEMKARYPLAEARVDVESVPGKPGSYNAVAYLRPWLQLEELTASMRLVAELPEKQG